MDAGVAWSKFLRELTRMNLDFHSIRASDEKSRGLMLEHMSSLSPIERVLVSSKWGRLATNPYDDSSIGNHLVNGMLSEESSTKAAPLHPSGVHSSARNQSLGTMGMMGSSPDPSYAPPQNVSMICSQARSALSRGDAVVALPLTLELLERDLNVLVNLLHEFLPHLTTEQLTNMLLVEGKLQGSGNVGVASAVEVMTTRTKTGNNINGDAETIQNRIAPYDPSASMRGTLPTGQPSLNGAPVHEREVLTAHSLAAQFGSGFQAWCNREPMTLPHVVRQGDVIQVIPSGSQLTATMRPNF